MCPQLTRRGPGRRARSVLAAPFVIATRLAPTGATFKPEHLERLADSIVSVEYYMETVSAGRSDPWYMLENAERCLDLLEKRPVVKTAARSAPEPAAGSRCRFAWRWGPGAGGLRPRPGGRAAGA